MNKRNFREVFKNDKVILPVIHCKDTASAVGSAKLAQRCGADGVFLINWVNGGLYKLGGIVKQATGMWVGINDLGLLPHEAMYGMPDSIDGLWSDCQVVVEGAKEQSYAAGLMNFREKIPWKGLFFGACAFKGQPSVKDYASFVQETAKYKVEVPTTSGPCTGRAPQLSKIRALREALDKDIPLAIASGTSPDNVRYYLDHIDVFLVATGVSNSSDFFDEDKLKRYVEYVREGKSLEAPEDDIKGPDDMRRGPDYDFDDDDYAKWLATRAKNNGVSTIPAG